MSSRSAATLAMFAQEYPMNVTSGCHASAPMSWSQFARERGHR